MASADMTIKVTVVRCEGCEDRALLAEALAAAHGEINQLRRHRDQVIDERDALYRLLEPRAGNA